MRKLATFAALIAATAAVPAIAQADTRWCKQGDPWIEVSAATSCSFAGSTVTYAFTRPGRIPRYAPIYSRLMHRSFWVTFRATKGGNITATGPHSIWMQFGDIGSHGVASHGHGHPVA
jgi:hypothetical protein